MMETGNAHTGNYDGRRASLFMLALVTGLLSAVTLGVYRFWAKTRIRKYIWSSTTVDGDSFEYTGTGLEKLLGFLTAVVVLAVYLGIIQLVLFYLGIRLFAEIEMPDEFGVLPIQPAAFIITFLGVLPLIFFAQYRARRYRLARTRWRGLRFGMDQGAWGYVVRALWYWFLTAVTFGIMLPLKTFHLEKYVVDRSWYGDARFEQLGRWTELFPAMRNLFLGVAFLVAGILVTVFAPTGFVIGLILAFVGVVWTQIGLLSYRVNSFIYLTGNKTLDGEIRFAASPKTSVIALRIIMGGFVVGILAAIIFGILGFLTAPALEQAFSEGGAVWVFAVVLVALLYFIALAAIDAMALVWITQPIIGHVVQSLSVLNAGALDGIHQRASDSGADAEGFADALDVGAAF